MGTSASSPAFLDISTLEMKSHVSTNSKPITQTRGVISQRIVYLYKSIGVAFVVIKRGGRKRLNNPTFNRRIILLFLAQGFTLPPHLRIIEIMLAISLLQLLEFS
jgi:hypothetical protein